MAIENDAVVVRPARYEERSRWRYVDRRRPRQEGGTLAGKVGVVGDVNEGDGIAIQLGWMLPHVSCRQCVVRSSPSACMRIRDEGADGSGAEGVPIEPTWDSHLKVNVERLGSGIEEAGQFVRNGEWAAWQGVTRSGYSVLMRRRPCQRSSAKEPQQARQGHKSEPRR